MTSKLKQIGSIAVPVVLMTMLGGCASVSDLEKVQKEVNEIKLAAGKANSTAQEAKSTADAASASAAMAERNSAAAMKGSETAVVTATQAQKTVNEATIAFPMMRYDPATNRFLVNWMIWPGMDQQAAPKQPAATNGVQQ